MAEGGRHLRPEEGGGSRPQNRRASGPEMDWGDMDWLEEEPQPEPRRETRQPSRQQQQPRQQQPRQQTRQQQPRQQQARQPSRQREYYDEYEEAKPRPQQRQRAPEERVYPNEPRRQSAPRQRQSARREEYYDDRPRRPAREVYRDDRRYEDPEPWRGRGHGLDKQSLPLIILVVVLVFGVLFAGGKLLGIMLDYRRDRSAYDELAENALSGMAEPDATPDPNAQAGSGDSGVTAPSSVNWDYLRSVNSDVIGYIYCPGTTINYPVVQTTDNDFYLHRSFWDKQENVSGTLFADSVCNIGSQYNNFIIYGHNMKDGSMFASLQKYVDATYYEQHPTIYFYTPQGDYRVELIAAHITESSMTNYPYYFNDDYDYQVYLNELTSHSFFATHTAVSTSYQLMTLSTCDYSGGYNDPRFLVHGLMIPVDAG